LYAFLISPICMYFMCLPFHHPWFDHTNAYRLWSSLLCSIF
jgi:hypothetical protein